MNQLNTRKILLLLILWTASCKTSTVLLPNAESTEKLPYSVAVIFSEELETYEIRLPLGIHPSLYEKGVVKSQNFSVGEELSASLLTNVNSILQTAKIIGEGDPSAINYDRIIKFSLKKDKCGFERRGDVEIDFSPWGYLDEGMRTYRSNFKIFIEIEVYRGGGLELTNSKSVMGSGTYRIEKEMYVHYDDKVSPIIMGLEKNKKRLRKAINDAIDDVCKKVGKVLTRDFLEQKKGIRVKAQSEQTELIINFKFLSTRGEAVALITVKEALPFENLKFGIPGDFNHYNLAEFNMRLSELYIKKGDKILLINGNTGAQDSIKIHWPLEFKQKTLTIDISKQLKKIKILK